MIKETISEEFLLMMEYAELVMKYFGEDYFEEMKEESDTEGADPAMAMAMEED